MTMAGKLWNSFVMFKLRCANGQSVLWKSPFFIMRDNGSENIIQNEIKTLRESNERLRKAAQDVVDHCRGKCRHVDKKDHYGVNQEMARCYEMRIRKLQEAISDATKSEEKKGN